MGDGQTRCWSRLAKVRIPGFSPLRLAKACVVATLRCPMSIPQDLEPAVRDPKKLRRTAWILVGMMILGGWLIFAAYNKWASQRAGDDRPSIVHRIQPERSLRVVRQDGKTADLMDLRGKVFAIHVAGS